MIKGKKGLFLSGQDIFLEECNVVLTQPKIKDIVLLGEEDFLLCSQTFAKIDGLSIGIREENPVFQEASDFQIFLVMVKQQESLYESMQKFFKMIFPMYEVKIDEGLINFYYENNIVGQIHNFNFIFVREMIQELFIPKIKGQEEIEYNPSNEKAKEIEKKLKAGRAKAAMANMKDEDKNASLFARFCSVLSIGLSLDINTLYNCTPYQIFDMFNRYSLKIKSDFYSKVATTPFMDVSKMEQPEDWMGNL